MIFWIIRDENVSDQYSYVGTCRQTPDQIMSGRRGSGSRTADIAGVTLPKGALYYYLGKRLRRNK